MQSGIVYREKELGKLMQAYRELSEKGFRVHFITGEAGTGKTVLLDSFTEAVGRMDEEVIITGSSCPVTSAGSEEYQPFKDILQTIMQEISETREARQSRREKWSRVFGASASVLLKVAPDLIENFVPMGTLLTSVGGKVLEETGVQKRLDALKAGKSMMPDLLKIADQYVGMLKMIARQYRLVFYIDNLQWIDRSSADLLHRMSTALRGLPVMFVGCYRSTDIAYLSGDERHPLEAFITHMKVDYREVMTDLDAFSPEEKRAFTDRLTDRDENRYSLFFRDEIFRRSGGNPLFVTELLVMLKANGTLRQTEEGVWIDHNCPDWQVFPERIEGIIRERVAGLEEGPLALLSEASVQGPCFLVQVLTRMSEKTESEVLRCLSEELDKQRHLVSEGACFRIGAQLVSPFYFPDLFLREYLYRRLGGSQRMLLHARAARALEELYAGKSGDVCRELAYHYENSGEGEQAVGYLKMCIDKAVVEADYGAVAEWARRGMRLAEGNDRIFFGLKELMALRIKGDIGLLERVELVSRIKEPDGKNDCPEWFWERWMLRFSEGELQSSLQMAEAFIKENRVEAIPYLAEGITYYWLGDFRRCRQSLAQYLRVSEEPGERLALCELYGALAAFHLAEYEESDRICRELSVWTERGGQAYYAAIGLLAKTWLAFLDEDFGQTEVYASALSKLAGERGIGGYVHWAGLFGAAVSGRREVWKGLELLKTSFSALQTGYGITLYGLMVCRLCFSKRLYDVYGSVWDEVVATAAKHGEKCYLGELLLLRGRSAEAQGEPEVAQIHLAAAKKEMNRSGEKRFGMEWEVSG